MLVTSTVTGAAIADPRGMATKADTISTQRALITVSPFILRNQRATPEPAPRRWGAAEPGSMETPLSRRDHAVREVGRRVRRRLAGNSQELRQGAESCLRRDEFSAIRLPRCRRAKGRFGRSHPRSFRVVVGAGGRSVGIRGRKPRLACRHRAVPRFRVNAWQEAGRKGRQRGLAGDRTRISRFWCAIPVADRLCSAYDGRFELVASAPAVKRAPVSYHRRPLPGRGRVGEGSLPSRGLLQAARCFLPWRLSRAWFGERHPAGASPSRPSFGDTKCPAHQACSLRARFVWQP